MMVFKRTILALFVALQATSCDAFAPSIRHGAVSVGSVPRGECRSTSKTTLRMGLDAVTYLRTEWISAALCTNQTPRSADVCLQLGCEDGRGVNFVPRTIREYITSTNEADGVLPVSVRRQLQQSQDRRGAAQVTFYDQRSDDLKDVDDESVDVVISLQAAAKMMENGLDWKKGVQEAARVLKPGGRFLFVEQDMVDGESYIDFVENLGLKNDQAEGQEFFPTFDDIGYDSVDLVLTPHTAGVALKSIDAGLSVAERNEKIKRIQEDEQAELSIAAFERGIKKRKKKKKGIANKTEETK